MRILDIHLQQPQDNDVPMKGWSSKCEGKPEFTDPVTFSWGVIGTGVPYDYSNSRVECPYTHITTVTGGRTTDTRKDIALVPSKPGEFYVFRISAYKNGTPVGMLIAHGGNGHGWDYRFRVKQTSADSKSGSKIPATGEKEHQK